MDYKNKRSLPEEKYVNPNNILAAYCKEIKSWPQFKPADGTAYLEDIKFRFSQNFVPAESFKTTNSQR